VGSDNKVSIRPVKAGEKLDSFWLIDEGLKPGERIVTEGLQKVKQGTVVLVKSEAAPAQEKAGRN